VEVEVEVSRVFWRDTLLVGTLLNVASVITTAMLLKAEAPTWVAALAHFGLLPYNVFLVAATRRLYSEPCDDRYVAQTEHSLQDSHRPQPLRSGLRRGAHVRLKTDGSLT
jgi:hypothetical protein